MTEQNPNQDKSIDAEGLEKNLDELGKKVAETVNVHIEQAKQNPVFTRNAILGLTVTAGITYFAAKKGAASAIKDLLKENELYSGIAEQAAMDANTYAQIAENNAKFAHEVNQEIGGVLSDISKSVKALAKKR